MLLLGLLCLISFSSSAAEPYTLFFTRHAEKINSSSQDPALTDVGHQRAGHLARFLKNSRIQAVFSTDYRRTRQTALPLAQQLNVELTIYDPRQLTALANTIIERKENVLIVGHSNTTPDLVTLVGGAAEPIHESSYGKLYAVRIENDHRSTQVYTIDP